MPRSLFYKNFLLITILLSLVSSPFSFLKINKSEAQEVAGFGAGTVTLIAVTDPVTLGYYSLSLTAQQLVAGVFEPAAIADRLVKFAWKLAGQLLKKLILDKLVEALVAYISGQTDTIIEDWDAFFDQAADDAIGLIAEKLTRGLICSNFDINLRAILIPLPKFSQRVNCSLSQIVSNIDSFINNFENGSWLAYQEQWYPQNNFYGTALTLLDERSFQTAKAKDTAFNQTSGGFFSQIKCDPPGSNKNCRVITPGSYIANQITKGLGIEKDILGIVTADDIAAYIAAIANAGINRLAILGIDGLRGYIKKKPNESTFTNTTSQNPCFGLTGEAFRACTNTQILASNTFKLDQINIQNQFKGTLDPRKEASFTLSQLITTQSEFVGNLEALNSCKPGDTNIKNQLAQELSILEDLQNKLDDNQTFLESLEESSERVNNATTGDWLALSNTLINNQQLIDPGAASRFQSDIENEKIAINQKINSQLPGIKSQLTGCPNAPKNP